MKKLILLATLTVAVSACSACAKKDQTPPAEQPPCSSASCQLPSPPAPTPPADIPDVVSQDNWQFSLIGPGWVLAKEAQQPIQVAFTNQSQNLSVFLWKEPTSKNYADFVVSTIRAIRADGSAQIQSATQVTLGTDKFVLATIKDDTNIVYGWMTVKSGFGYVFGCGGPANVDAGIGPCQKMADTLQIK